MRRESKISHESLKLVEYRNIEAGNREMNERKDGKRSKEHLKKKKTGEKERITVR